LFEKLMTIHDIIKHFSSYTAAPVDPDDVAKQIKLAGIRDQIFFVEVDIEVRVLRGALHTYVLTKGVYSDPDICSDIFYAANQSRAWKRLVCCKELLHILDQSVSQTSTIDDFDKLIRGLCVPPNLGSINDGVQIWTDRLMFYYASAIVFPMRARELLLAAKIPAGQTLQEVAARVLDIPEPVAMLVLSDNWPSLYKAIIGSK